VEFGFCQERMIVKEQTKRSEMPAQEIHRMRVAYDCYRLLYFMPRSCFDYTWQPSDSSLGPLPVGFDKAGCENFEGSRHKVQIGSASHGSSAPASAISLKAHLVTL
jgi:hypothetical protein